jgi:hypothetical protein
VATLCRDCWLAQLLLSRETDENLCELLDIERITTFVTHPEPS